MTEIRRRNGRPIWLDESGKAHPLRRVNLGSTATTQVRAVHKHDLPFDDGILEQLLWPAAHNMGVRW